MITEHEEIYYQPNNLNFFEKIRFNITLKYNEIQGEEKFPVHSKIIPGLYLGRIPKEVNQLPPDTKLIVSTITYGELAAVNFDFAKLTEQGIKHALVIMEDFDHKVFDEAAIHAIGAMHGVEEGKGIYIHCKAGRARSGMLTALFLAMVARDMQSHPELAHTPRYKKYGEFITYLNNHKQSDVLLDNTQLFEAAEAFLKQKRPQVSINQNKKTTAIEMMDTFRGTLEDALKQYTHAHDIHQMPSFKALMLFILKHPSIKKIIPLPLPPRNMTQIDDLIHALNEINLSDTVKKCKEIISTLKEEMLSFSISPLT